MKRTLRWTLALIFLTVCLISGCTAQYPAMPLSPSTPEELAAMEEYIPQGQLYRYPFEYDGSAREYFLYVPPNAEKGSPLLVLLHGYTWFVDGFWQYINIEQLADQHGIVVCMPQGLPDRSGITCWNASMGDQVTTTNDTGFLKALARDLQSTYDLDPARTYAAGFSNGGYMAYTLALDASDVFTAVASVGGSMSRIDWKRRETADPASILHIHGVEDKTIKYLDMEENQERFGGAPGIQTVLSYWGKDVNQAQVVTRFRPYDNTKAYIYEQGIDEHRVWLLEMSQFAHSWPSVLRGDPLHANDVIWSFFEGHQQ